SRSLLLSGTSPSPATAAGGHVVNDLAAGSPRRRIDATAGRRQLPLRPAGDCHSPRARPVAARRCKRDFGIVRRPAWHVVVGGILRQLPELAGARVKRPDVVVAAKRIAAIGGKRDASTIMRPGRLAIVERAPSQLVLIGSIRRDGPDVIAALAIPEKRDPFAVRRPGRLSRVVEQVGDARCRASRSGKRP